MRYLGAGGHCDVFDIDAHLQGILALDPPEHDTLAYVLNERLDELATEAHIPYLGTVDGAPTQLKQVIANLLDENLGAA